MKRTIPVPRRTRHALFRLAAVILLVAEVVAIGFAPITEGSEQPDFPTHIEAPGAPPHAGHHPGICAFCVLRHFSPLPIRRSATVVHVAPPQTLRPGMKDIIPIARHDRPDPARAPPSPTSQA